MNEAAGAPPRARSNPAAFIAFSIVLFVLLIGLGIWQLERKAWKEGLIDMLDRRLSAQPVPLPPRTAWVSLDQAKDEFRRVTFKATFEQAREGRVYTGGSALRKDIKGPGYFAFAPARTSDGGVVVVDRGYVPNPRPSASLKPIAISNTPVEIVGVLRWPEAPGWFVTPHSVTDDLWFVRDQNAMAATNGWGEVAPFYIDQESPVPPGGFPRPAPLRPNLRDAHLQYALTWFGLALVLAVAFAYWLRNRWREMK